MSWMIVFFGDVSGDTSPIIRQSVWVCVWYYVFAEDFVLDFEKNWKTRTIKESIYSEENEHHINGISFKLPNIWKPILRENKAKKTTAKTTTSSNWVRKGPQSCMVPYRSEFKINQSGTTSEYFDPLQTHNTRHTLTHFAFENVKFLTGSGGTHGPDLPSPFGRKFLYRQLYLHVERSSTHFAWWWEKYLPKRRRKKNYYDSRHDKLRNNMDTTESTNTNIFKS